jgi:hypothetical protein
MVPKRARSLLVTGEADLGRADIALVQAEPAREGVRRS